MNKDEIIDRISMLRTRANYSARRLSLDLGMNQCYINRMETSHDFLPSLEVFMDIIETCGSTPSEFFYYNMDEYKNDKEIIELLKKVSPTKKQALIGLLKDN